MQIPLPKNETHERIKKALEEKYKDIASELAGKVSFSVQEIVTACVKGMGSLPILIGTLVYLTWNSEPPVRVGACVFGLLLLRLMFKKIQNELAALIKQHIQQRLLRLLVEEEQEARMYGRWMEEAYAKDIFVEAFFYGWNIAIHSRHVNVENWEITIPWTLMFRPWKLEQHAQKLVAEFVPKVLTRLLKFKIAATIATEEKNEKENLENQKAGA